MPNTNVRAINLMLLTALDTESQMQVRAMRADQNIGVNEHLGWINQLKSDDRQIVFVARDAHNTPFGVVHVSAIDRRDKTADWTFYLAQNADAQLDCALEYAMINFVFDVLELEKLNCEVIEGNQALIALHAQFLFANEGFRRSNTIQNDKRIGIHLFGLTQQEWISGKAQVREKHIDILNQFAIAIHWHDAKADNPRNPIDEIEKARARNNVNWMNILRLALEKSPEVSKPIVAEIRKIDREISDLTDKLSLDDT